MPKFAALALFLTAISAAQAQQSRVEGQVTSATGEPLKNATVRLRSDVRLTAPPPRGERPPPDTVYSALSDASGHFAIDAPAGRYRLSAERTGYFQRSFSSQITLAAAEPFKGITLALVPEARIEGKITDQDGDPVPLARLSIDFWSSLQGEKILSPSLQNDSDGDGSFIIGGLGDGYYRVCASPSYPPGTPKGVSAHQALVTTCSPGATDVASATLIKVTPGAVVRGVDIRMRTAAVYSVKGRLAEPASAEVELTPSGGQPILQMRGSTFTLPDGSFEIHAVTPGTYRLEITSRDRSGGPPVAPAFAAQEITVGREDLEGVVLHLAPGLNLAGKIMLEDGSSAAPPGRRFGVSLVPIGSRHGVGQISVGADGGFSIANVPPEKYSLLVTGAAPGTYLKSVTLGSQDVTNQIIDLTTAPAGDLRILFSPHAAELSGATPGQGIRVIAWRPGLDHSSALTATTNANGRFRFTNLAPGEYRVAAWQDPGPLIFPEFLKQFESAAAPVTLAEDGRSMVDAPMIGRNAIEAAIANIR